MRTKILPPAQTATPWLERGATEGSEKEVIELNEFPFTLGRNEACDYQIPSTRVSREHAEIVRDGRGYRLRDLDSTNGTFVNGQRQAAAKLADGDLVVIADVEFTFHFPSDESLRKVATQVMSGRYAAGHEDGEENAARDLIHVIRTRQEAILHAGLRNRFQPIVDLDDGQAIGFEALQRPHANRQEATTSEAALQSIDCRLSERAHQLLRLLAVEHAARCGTAKMLFLKLQPAEVGADSLPESLARLQQIAGGNRIIAEIPHSAVVDIPYFRAFWARLCELNVGIAYDGFAGGQNQVRAQREFAPGFLKLAPTLACGVDRSSQRQQQIRDLVQAADEIGAKLIAAGIHSENEAQTCRELGCHLAQGDHYGRPQTIDWPLSTALA